ncbi:hypothetical protein K1T71_005157 [Dendrolimus kikuchii]|uniref:Uncharacterized protein n=1 Tax=Dendrolimus kikuchii TaxID=765133 RepID=A0ACC1D6F7_9NEOP|nr:hypothetical protein K1T71_005157 [Dendrolimus kikuchii]
MQIIKVVSNPEYVSEDILDEDFITTFKHIHCMQVLLGSCRVNVKNRFVTTPSLFQKFYTLILMICAFGLNYIAVQVHFDKFKDYKSIYYLRLASVFVEIIKYICIIIHVRFLNGDANAEFFIKLQKTDRLMKIDRNPAINNILYRINVATVVFLTIYFLTLGIISIGSRMFIFLTLIGLAYSQHVFLLEMMLCTNILMYFFLRIRFVNSILKNYLYPPEEKLTKSFLITKNAIRYLAAETHDFASSDTDLYLKELFDSFFQFQTLYRFQILVFCFKCVISNLLTFEFAIFAMQSSILDTTEILITTMYLSFDLLIALLLSIRCESFYREIKETKRLCIGVMALYQDGPLREKARKMLSLIEEDPPSFNVYDMWQVDASIFVNILSLITNLVLTLLQFAFL